MNLLKVWNLSLHQKKKQKNNMKDIKQIQKQIEKAKTILADIELSYKNKDGRYGIYAYNVQHEELKRLQSL